MCRTTAKKLSSSDVSTNSDWFAAILRDKLAALLADEKHWRHQACKSPLEWSVNTTRHSTGLSIRQYMMRQMQLKHKAAPTAHSLA